MNRILFQFRQPKPTCRPWSTLHDKISKQRDRTTTLDSDVCLST